MSKPARILHRPWSAVLVALALCACDVTPQVNAPPVLVARPPPPVPPATASWHQIKFEGQSFTLKDKDRVILDQVVSELLNKPGSVITVIGRIDRPGGPDDLMSLSQRRFEGVRDTLIYRGNVSPDRIQTLRTDTSPRTGAAGRNTVDVAVH